jgi:hypothetical protein
MRRHPSLLAVAIVAASVGCSSAGSPPVAVGSTGNGDGNGATAGDGSGTSGGSTGGSGTSGGTTGTSGGSTGNGGSTGGGSDCPQQVTRLASGMHHPGPLAVDATYLYWADQSGPTASIERVAKSGGTPEAVTADDLDTSADSYGVAGLAVDGEGIYWSTYASSGGAEPTSLLFAYRFADHGTSVIANTALISDLAVADGTIYYSNPSGLWRVDTAGGWPQPMATFPAGRLAVDAWHVFVAANSALYRVDRDTQASETLASNFSTPDLAVAVDFDHAYVVDALHGLWRIDAPGAQPTHFYDDNLPATASLPWIQLVGDQLYFSNNRWITRMPTSGNGLAFLAEDAGSALVDGDRLFFTRADEIDVVCR